MTETKRAWIGLGANLGDPAAQISLALQQLAAHPAIRLEACSAFYRSPAMTLPGDDGVQPDYCNAVARIQTALSAQALLELLLQFEQQQGRERLSGQRWQARTLDLDLLWMRDVELQLKHLQLPHPGVAEREFVLQPWVDLNPQLEVAQLGVVAKMLRGLTGAPLPSWRAAHALS